MNKNWLSESASGFRISVNVSPGGKTSQILSAGEDLLRIRIKAPPVDGKANDELIRFIAKKTGLAKTNIRIMHGFTGRRKLLEIHAPALTRQNLEEMLAVD